MKEHGPDIPIESLKAMKYTFDNFHTEKNIALDSVGNQQWCKVKDMGDVTEIPTHTIPPGYPHFTDWDSKYSVVMSI